MKHSYSLAALFIGTFLFSQTKLIAYKSHSGSMNRFENAVSRDIFDVNDSNLGLPPAILKVDSVIFLDNDKAKIITETKRFKQEKGVRNTLTVPLKNSGKNINKKIIDSLLYRNYDVIPEKDSIVFLKYNKKMNTYKKVNFRKPKPEIKKSEIQNKSLLNNDMILHDFIISGFSALDSWRKSRNYES